MKKIWILGIVSVVLCLVLAFLVGAYIGTEREARRTEEARIQGDAVVVATLIAVVNSDTGVLIGDAYLNYSAAIIETLGADFVLVSPAMARTGFTEGLYRAIVTFPSNVSERIASFNTANPERVMLEIQVSPALSESDYIDTHLDMLRLQSSINMTTANAYVTSLFAQFHSAQDQMGIVFLNNQDSLDALDIVQFEDFTPALQLDFLPDILFEPNEADTAQHLLTVEDFAAQVQMLYLDGFIDAAISYSTMRERVDALTDDFPTQRDEWLFNARAWVEDWVAYTQELQGEVSDMNALLAGHHDDLDEWLEHAEAWLTGLEDWFEGRIDDWRDEVDGAVGSWRDAAEDWHGIASERFENWRAGLNFDVWDEIMSSAGNRPSLADIDPCGCQDPVPCSEFDCSCSVNYDCPCAGGNGLPCDPSCVCGDVVPCPCAGGILSDGSCGCDAAKLEELRIAWVTQIGEDMLATLESADNPREAGAWLVSFAGNGLALDLPPVPAPPFLPNPPEPDKDVPDEPPVWEDDINIAVNMPDYAAPPQPDDLWTAIYEVRIRMQEFDVDNYMTDELWAQAQMLLSAYDAYLVTIRNDLSLQFMENILLLTEVRAEYLEYLADLRADAIASEESAREHLLDTLQAFFEVVDSSGRDTHYRLAEFAAMMPESRTAAGINQDLVNFTIAPFDFVEPALRMDVELAAIAGSEFMMITIWITAAALGAVLLALIIIVGLKLWKRHRDGDIAES